MTIRTEKKDRKKKASAPGQYMTRTHAIKRLQVSLQDFRKLCILKGIYPRDPKKKHQGGNKTYYLTKDIAFLMHDPLLEKFRQKKTLRKKIRSAKGKREFGTVKRLQQNHPVLHLDHIIKERYPTFQDALRDLDDALCTIALFARMPQTIKIPGRKIKRCNRLCLELQNYIMRTHSLRKVFLSIKGIYYQAELHGQTVTWLAPYHFAHQINKDIDVRIMLTFLEFYTSLLSFVLYKLYITIGMHYPPVFDGRLSNLGENISTIIMERLPAPAVPTTQSTQKETANTLSSEIQKQLQTLDQIGGDENGNDEDEEGKESPEEALELQRLSSELAGSSGTQDKYATLFRGMHFFLGREVPREALEFVILSFGGKVSWGGSFTGVSEGDPSITHSIVDRPALSHRFLNHEYVQPQWIFDCVNVCALLPTHEYVPGATLPPHLSPFVDNDAVGYTPARAEQINAILGRATSSSSVTTVVEDIPKSEEQQMAEREEQYKAELADETDANAGNEKKNKKKKKATPKFKNEDDDGYDEATYASMVLSNKKKRLWNAIQRSNHLKTKKTDRLRKRRALIESKAHNPN